MKKILVGFACFALAAIGLAALSWGWAGLALGRQVPTTLAKVDKSVDALNIALDEINRPCTVPVKGEEKSCGTVADVNQTLHAIRDAAGVVVIAGKHEDAQLKTLDRQEATLFNDLHSTAIAARGTINAATGTLEALTATAGVAQKSMEAAGPLLDAGTRTANTLNQTISSSAPDLHRFLKAAADTTEQGKRIVTDGADEADKFVHPPSVKKTFWGSVWFVVHHVPLPPIL